MDESSKVEHTTNFWKRREFISSKLNEQLYNCVRLSLTNVLYVLSTNQGVRVARSRMCLGGVVVGFLRTIRVGVGFCYLTPTPEVQLNYFLHRTPTFGIPTRDCWNFTISYETFIETEISCCVGCQDYHWLLFAAKLLTAKLHLRYVKESEWEILERSESDILPPTPQPCY